VVVFLCLPTTLVVGTPSGRRRLDLRWRERRSEITRCAAIGNLELAGYGQYDITLMTPCEIPHRNKISSRMFSVGLRNREVFAQVDARRRSWS
jgi:hypothetical protein